MNIHPLKLDFRTVLQSILVYVMHWALEIGLFQMAHTVAIRSTGDLLDHAADSVSQVCGCRVICPVCSSVSVTKSGVHCPLSNRCRDSGMPMCSQHHKDYPKAATHLLDAQDSPLEPSELLFLSELCQSTRILEQIPQMVRHLVTSKLAGVLDNVSAKNNNSSWACLFKFSRPPSVILICVQAVVRMMILSVCMGSAVASATAVIHVMQSLRDLWSLVREG